MIKASVEEVRAAYRALRRINEEVRLTGKAAWRVSRLLNKLKPEVVSFEEAQLALFRGAGGSHAGGGIQIEPPARGDDESQADWDAKLKEHKERINKLNDNLMALNKESVEIDYDPLPLSLFDDDSMPKEKQPRFSANDFADLGQFLTEP